MVLPFLISIPNVINDNRPHQPRLTILLEYLNARLLLQQPFIAGVDRFQGDAGSSGGIQEECGIFGR